jgi:N-acetylmuramoyl-L-alanine amidase
LSNACAHRAAVANLPVTPQLTPQKLTCTRRCIVIDPGHGGHELGTRSRDGTLEKDVVLAIATQLKNDLESDGFEVVLTRWQDPDVSLQQRTALANQLNAQLFVSIHANFAPETYVHGIETYYFGADKSGTVVQRENKAAGFRDLSPLILADLIAQTTSHASFALAVKVQEHLVKKARYLNPHIKDLGVKSGLFHVLMGARIPAVLVETAFLSNPQEAKLVATKNYQRLLAGALRDAIKEYLVF